MKEHSPWQGGAAGSGSPLPAHDLECDVVIVGAGITGLTVALELVRAERRVAVLEAAAIGGGATGATTGHLTACLDRSYHELMDNFGADGAELAVESSLAAIAHIEQNAARLAIHCGFERVPGYRFTEAPDRAAALEREAELAVTLGLDATLVTRTPLPFPIALALRLERQAQLEPLRYAAGLADEIRRRRGIIYTGARVTGVEGGSRARVLVGDRKITADAVVLATHTPIQRVLALQSRLGPYESYAIACRLRQAVPTGLHWDTEQPYHYIRGARDDEGELLVVGGEDHKIGQSADTRLHFRELETWARSRFEIDSIAYRWSGDVFESVDGLPYIGHVGGADNVFVGTGYAGTGLTFGTLAGMIISDLALGRGNPYATLYSPSRVKPIASLRGFVKENANVAWHWVADRMSHPADTQLADLPPGEGRLIEIDGKKAAVYRDPDARVHVLSPVCTHAGCLVEWNTAARTWDCACHGGRYHPTGEVMSGPPTAPLSERESHEAIEPPQRVAHHSR